MPFALKAILLSVALCAGIYDLRFRRIPNWLNVAGVVLGMLLNFLLVPNGLLPSLAGVGCALVIYLPLYLVRGMGAGDVKLMAAVGAIAGASNWFLIFLGTALIAGAASLLLVIVRRRVRQTAANLLSILSALLQRQSPAAVNPALQIGNTQALRMPHGAFIASGAMLFLFLSAVE